MIRRLCVFFMAVIFISRVHAQNEAFPRIDAHLDLTIAAGNQEGTAAFSYVRNWRLGQARRLELGFGLRSTTYTGTQKEFYTAPASLARTSTVPFVNVFSGHAYQNVDTLTVATPFTTSLNISLNAGYRLGNKWYVGLNIDLLGFTFGTKSSAILHTNGKMLKEPEARTSSWNLLLTGDLDYGALNSEFFVRYNISNRWAVKVAYQFFFTEYNTQSIHQTAPDGTSVYRFRNKANLLGLGVSYDL
jgi:hypothetical protein